MDFTGGMFEFVEENGVDADGDLVFKLEEALSPKAGRLVSFTGGNENPHKVNIVRGGTRYVLSFWFTCSSEHAFPAFLDGEIHKQFQPEPQPDPEL